MPPPPGVIDSPRISSLSNVPEENTPTRGGSPYLHQSLSGSTSTFKALAPAASTTSLNSTASAARPPMGPRNPSNLRTASSASIGQQLEASTASSTTPTVAGSIMSKKGGIPRTKSPMGTVKEREKEKEKEGGGGGKESHNIIKGSRSVANMSAPSGAQPRLRSTPHLSYPKEVELAPATLMYWSRTPAYGVMPGHGMRAHSATLIDSTAWIFGGCDERGCWKDIWCFNTETMQWSHPDMLGDTPPPCRAHTTTLVDRRLVVFGGGEGPVYRNDVYILDTMTRRWTQPRFPPDAPVPPPRRAHTAVFYRNKVWVFGGGNGTQALNDLWTLDVGLKFDSLLWSQVKLDVFHRRLSHTATQVGSYLFIWGGHDGTQYTSELLLFNLVSLNFEGRTIAGKPPIARGYHAALIADSRLFIFGGFNGNEVFDDVHNLDLAGAAYLPQVTSFTIDVD
ncbi:hypothetical protein NLI96_g11094 [Meripilus lineatus]|uniref:Galactose oxidase n=1 Tax=Meripilus lineatus TaxID=2056292 RepID=A0AAD5YDQ0_9APHY|nr:hypothetical protein NLI96_g11094 [Physisporinus lineatus]